MARAINVSQGLRLRFVRHPIRVSILGSCRQDSLYKLFKVSNVRDGLTYPHSSGEILQALRYLTDLSQGADVPLYCFRNYQLGSRILPRQKLCRAFAKSDVVVVEIASRQSYVNQGLFIHHEWYDDKNNDTVTSISREDVQVLIESDFEIERNILEIVKLCKGKKVLFITHLSTKRTGKRADLARLILDIGLRNHLEVFDSSSMLDLYPIDKIMLQEEVLSHFTEFGHEVVGGRLENMILGMLNKRRLTQVVSNSDERERTIGTHGIGDSIFGSITLHQEARRLHRASSVSISKHSLSELLQKNHTECIVQDSLVRALFHEDDYNQFGDIEFCYTNKRPRFPISVSDKDFVKNAFFRFDQTAIAAIEKQLEQFCLPKSFSLIHLRFGDEVLLGSIGKELTFQRLCFRLLDLIEEIGFEKNSSLFLSDSIDFQKFLRSKNYNAVFGPIAHAGKSNLSNAQTLSLVTDLGLMSMADVIYQASAYRWQSGFSSSVAQLFDIELHQLDKISHVLRVHRENGDSD